MKFPRRNFLAAFSELLNNYKLTIKKSTKGIDFVDFQGSVVFSIEDDQLTSDDIKKLTIASR